MSHDRREFGPWAETLSSREVTALLAMMYSAPIVFAPIRMFDVAGASAWIAGLLAGVAGAAIVLVWVVLSASFPGRILPEFVGEIVGRQIGWAVNLIFSVYFFYEVAVSNRMIAEVVLHVLPETPIGAIMAMSLIVTAVVTRLGPEVLGRMALIHLGVVSVGFLPMIVALAPLVQLRNFLPVLTGGWLPVFRAASPPAALLGHIALVSFLLPLMSKDPAKSGDAQAHGKEGIKVGMLGIGISWLWFYILLLLEQGVFTAEESRRLAIPALSLARAIDFGVFFERVEVSLLAGMVAGRFAQDVRLSLCRLPDGEPPDGDPVVSPLCRPPRRACPARRVHAFDGPPGAGSTRHRHLDGYFGHRQVFLARPAPSPRLHSKVGRPCGLGGFGSS